MIQTLETILILNLDSPLADRICKNYCSNFNIIGISNEEIDGFDNITHVVGDLINDTEEVLSDIIEYATIDRRCTIEYVLNNTFNDVVNASLDITDTHQYFEDNVFRQLKILDYLNKNLWSTISREENLKYNRSVINLHPHQKNTNTSSVYDSAKSSFLKLSTSMLDDIYTNHGVGYVNISTFDLSNKEYVHCCIGMLQKIMWGGDCRASIRIDKNNYKKIHQPLTNEIFTNNMPCTSNDYKTLSEKSKRSVMEYYIKGLSDCSVFNSHEEEDFKYIDINHSVTGEVINDINKEFLDVLSNGTSKSFDKNLFSKYDEYGTYTYVPEIYGKNYSKNSKNLFVHSVFKKFLEDKFNLSLSSEVYMQYIYRKDNGSSSEINTGCDRVYFPPISAPVNCIFNNIDGEGILNVHQLENNYTKNNNESACMIRDRKITVFVFLNDLLDSRGDGGIGIYSNDKELIHEFRTERNSMLIFENNDSSFYGFLPNEKEERILQVNYHIKKKESNKTDKVNISEYIPESIKEKV